MRHYGLSTRAYDRICKVAWTMADLAETETITVVHLSEAMPYCTLDRAFEVWYTPIYSRHIT